MRNELMISAAVSALLLGMSASAALAQHGGGMGGGGTGMMPPSAQLPRGDLDQTQDRLRDQDQTPDYDRDRDRMRDKDQADMDRDRDRDRLHTSQVLSDQLASFSLLTSAERAQFRSEMRAAKTTEERSQIRARHQQTIQNRARELGIDAPAGAGAGLGYQAHSGYMLMTMLTEQERAQFSARLQSARTAQERQQIRQEMRATAREHARELGVDLPEWYGQGPGPR